MLDALDKLKKLSPTLTKIHRLKSRPKKPVNTESDYYDDTGEITQSVLIPSKDAFFSVLEKIGSGAYGVVKRSHNLHTDKVAALKIQDINKTRQVHEQLSKTKVDTAEKESTSQNEATQQYIQLQLDTEENLTKSLGRFYGSLYRTNIKGVKKKYLFMEYFEGKSLYERTKQGYSFEEKVKIAQEITEELRKIHALHYLHLDLSLHNTLYLEDAKIIDFGYCAYLDTKEAIIGPFRGTHIPPEMFKQHESDGQCILSAAVDAFALGMIIYEIFSSNVFDPYKYEAYDEYKAYYTSFYQSALKEINSSPEEPWKDLVRDLIDENPQHRKGVDYAQECLKALHKGLSHSL